MLAVCEASVPSAGSHSLPRRPCWPAEGAGCWGRRTRLRRQTSCWPSLRNPLTIKKTFPAKSRLVKNVCYDFTSFSNSPIDVALNVITNFKTWHERSLSVISWSFSARSKSKRQSSRQLLVDLKKSVCLYPCEWIRQVWIWRSFSMSGCTGETALKTRPMDWKSVLQIVCCFPSTSSCWNCY